MTSPPNADSQESSHASRFPWGRWILTAFFILSVAFWGVLTTHLMQASKQDVSDLKIRMMHHPMVQKIMPNRVRKVLRDPELFDHIGHFVFYLPCGLAIGLGAEFFRWWYGKRVWKKAFLGLLIAVLAWAAFDEWAQRFALQRSSNLTDLAFTYIGILSGLILYFLGLGLVAGVCSAKRFFRPRLPKDSAVPA